MFSNQTFESEINIDQKSILRKFLNTLDLDQETKTKFIHLFENEINNKNKSPFKKKL